MRNIRSLASPSILTRSRTSWLVQVRLRSEGGKGRSLLPPDRLQEDGTTLLGEDGMTFMSLAESVLIFGNIHFTCDYSNHIEMVIHWEEGAGGAVNEIAGYHGERTGVTGSLLFS